MKTKEIIERAGRYGDRILNYDDAHLQASGDGAFFRTMTRKKHIAGDFSPIIQEADKLLKEKVPHDEARKRMLEAVESFKTEQLSTLRAMLDTETRDFQKAQMSRDFQKESHLLREAELWTKTRSDLQLKTEIQKAERSGVFERNRLGLIAEKLPGEAERIGKILDDHPAEFATDDARQILLGMESIMGAKIGRVPYTLQEGGGTQFLNVLDLLVQKEKTPEQKPEESRAAIKETKDKEAAQKVSAELEELQRLKAQVDASLQEIRDEREQIRRERARLSRERKSTEEPEAPKKRFFKKGSESK